MAHMLREVPHRNKLFATHALHLYRQRCKHAHDADGGCMFLRHRVHVVLGGFGCCFWCTCCMQDNTCLEVERTDFTWMGYTMRTER